MVARLAYLGTNGHINELYYTASAGKWGAADVTALTRAVTAAATPVAVVTNFAGQVEVARLECLGSNGHINELSLAGNWVAADLTALTKAGNAFLTPVAYMTNFTSQGELGLPYIAIDGHIDELYCAPASGVCWGNSALQ